MLPYHQQYQYWGRSSVFKRPVSQVLWVAITRISHSSTPSSLSTYSIILFSCPLLTWLVSHDNYWKLVQTCTKAGFLKWVTVVWDFTFFGSGVTNTFKFSLPSSVWKNSVGRTYCVTKGPVLEMWWVRLGNNFSLLVKLTPHSKWIMELRW